MFSKETDRMWKINKEKKANKNLIHAYEPKKVRLKDTAKVNKTNTNPKRVKKEKKRKSENRTQK